MIRINLLKSHQAPGVHPLVGRREAIFGAALLALACVALFYLSNRSTRRSEAQPAPAAQVEQVSALQPAQQTPATEETPAPPAPGRPPRPAPGPAAAAPVGEATGCTVADISFEPQGEALLVRVRASAETKYNSFDLDTPPRLAIDLPGCQLAVSREQYSQRVDHPLVQRVRVSLFQESPPVVRLVLDLATKSRYQISTSREGLQVRVLEAAP